MTDRSQKLLLLVDGSSYLYRAFHALPDLRNREGLPTGAIFGVLNMLRRLMQDYKPDYAACVFDARGPTFRDEWYPQYKANRPPMPPDLASQITPLQEAVRALGWPLLVVEGVEADDVIGTLTHEASLAGMGTVISTGDKDMVQLLTPGVTLVNTMSNEVLDGEAAMQKYGVRPDQFIDYLTLMGDTSDNVPGVAKVGPKTAQKWIDRYGNLDKLLLHADDVTGAVGENLRSAREWLPQARRLITIRCDIALPVAATALQMNEPDLPSLHALAERYDLRSWVKSGAAGHQGADAGTAGAARTQAGAGPAAKVDAVLNEDHAVAPLVPVRYDTVTTMEQLEVWIARIEAASLTAFDTETNSLDPMTTQLVGFSLCVTPYEACYVPLAHCGPDQPLQLNLKDTLARMKPWLENPAAKKARPVT